jgi:hypothetical protein
MPFQQAFSEEPLDREVAELVLEVGTDRLSADRLSAKEEIGTHYELKRVFGETPGRGGRGRTTPTRSGAASSARSLRPSAGTA